jgi:hypothetical protein
MAIVGEVLSGVPVDASAAVTPAEAITARANIAANLTPVSLLKLRFRSPRWPPPVVEAGRCRS